jgi:predicted transcriptional regulator
MKNPFDSRVSQWMVSPVFTIREDAPLAEAARRFDELGVSELPVLDGSSRLTGIISRADLLQAGRFVRQSRDRERHLWLPEARVSEFTRSRVPVVRRDLTLSMCARHMLMHHFRRVYVAEDGPLEGVVSTREMMRAVAEAHVEAPLESILTRTISALHARSSLAEATATLRADPSLTLVVTRSAVPVGVFSRDEAAIAREADPGDAVELWMDCSVLSLPVQTPTHRAAAQAYEGRCRYLVINDAENVTGLTSGIGFAQIVAGQA